MVEGPCLHAILRLQLVQLLQFPQKESNSANRNFVYSKIVGYAQWELPTLGRRKTPSRAENTKSQIESKSQSQTWYENHNDTAPQGVNVTLRTAKLDFVNELEDKYLDERSMYSACWSLLGSQHARAHT